MLETSKKKFERKKKFKEKKIIGFRKKLIIFFSF
jgi:hypothetical protein